MIMRNTDYSTNAPLLDEETTDYDTSALLDTGINDSRMRLPTRYDIAKFYKRNIHNIEKGYWVKKKQQIDFTSEFDWQITYSFPDTLRNPRTLSGKFYGGIAVTFRRLYLILCQGYNKGRFFIDDYFETVYPYTVKPVVDDKLLVIKDDLLSFAEDEMEGAVATKEGNFDKRYKINRGMKAKLKRYESFAKEWEDSEGMDVAAIIKEDIIDCLMSGQIPLAYKDTVDTQLKRQSVGLSMEPRFFATAQLIESLQLYVKLRSKGKWQMSSGIRV